MDEMWVPLTRPRAADGDEILDLALLREAATAAEPAPPDEATRHPSEDGLAMPSELLAMASPSCEDIPDDEPLPTCRVFGGAHVPDFSRIPPVQWEEALRATPRELRLIAVERAALPPEEFAALLRLALAADVPAAPSERVRAAVRARPQLAPTPAADHFRRANRQVNFRLTEPEYLDLATAAVIIGTSPTGLAAQLVRNGVRRVIEEANRPTSS